MLRLTIALTLLISCTDDAPAQKFGRPEGVTFTADPNPNASATLFRSPDGKARLINHAGDELIPGGLSSPFSGHGYVAVEPIPSTGPTPGFLAYSGTTSVNRRKAVAMTWANLLLWSWDVPASSPWRRLHHDIGLLSCGSFLLLADEEVTDANVSPNQIIDDVLLEVDAAGTVQWVWNLRDHIGQLNLDARVLTQIAAKGGDWAHMNSAEEIPSNSSGDARFAAGNIICSCRFINRVFVIDRTTGNIVWNLSARTYSQHNAQVLPTGTVLIYDNGSPDVYPIEGEPRPPAYSVVREFDVAGSVVWKHGAVDAQMATRRMWSDILGGAQRLPSGNTLITEGVTGRCFEVQTDGDYAWEYMNPYAGFQGGPNVWFATYRSYRVFL